MESKEGRAIIGDADWATTSGSATTSSEIGAGEERRESSGIYLETGRQLIHDLPALPQTQPLQTPERLHLQHTDEGTDEESDVEDDSLPLVTGIGGGEGGKEGVGVGVGVGGIRRLTRIPSISSLFYNYI